MEKYTQSNLSPEERDNIYHMQLVISELRKPINGGYTVDQFFVGNNLSDFRDKRFAEIEDAWEILRVIELREQYIDYLRTILGANQ